MFMSSPIRGALAGAGLLALVSFPAAAQDGLEKFKELIADAPEGGFVYESGEALGDEGFKLTNVSIKPEPEDADAEAITIKEMVVERMDFDAATNGTPPKFMKMKLTGLSVTAGSLPEGGEFIGMLGTDTVAGDVIVDIEMDHDAQTMKINDVTLDLQGLGKLSIAIDIAGVGPEVMMAPDSAMGTGVLNSAKISYTDASLLAKALQIGATMNGMDVPTMLDTAKAQLGGLSAMAETDEAKTALAGIVDPLVAYMDDYESPKGALVIALQPAEPAPFANVMANPAPDAVVNTLGLSVTYPGN